MTPTEQSEFELVLGNKQLLSVFFIVVVLLAVFFFMGYVVGRNSGTALASTTRGTADVRTASDTGTRASPMPPSAAPLSTAEGQLKSPDAEPKAEEAAPARPAPAAAAPAEEPSSTPQSIGDPAAGSTWLQVVATSRPDAQLISETLSKRGFRTQVAPSPNGLFRVLVGPATTAAEQSELRTRLEGAGFKNPIVRKY